MPRFTGVSLRRQSNQIEDIVGYSACQSRYDLFILDKYFEQVCDPWEIYQKLKAMLAEKLEPVKLEHVGWMTLEENQCDLEKEMEEVRNQNSLLSVKDLNGKDPKDWKNLLSSKEFDNYTNYLKKLNQFDIPKESRTPRAVCVGQDPSYMDMSGSQKKLPAFTTDSTRRIKLTHLDRWLTAKEKMSVTGFPIHKAGQANMRCF